MSNGGAGRVRGATGARAFALLAAALLALPMIVVSVAPEAQAQSLGDPWWGPASRTDPTAGWAVRVPIVVENVHAYPLERAIVGVDLDLNRLLADAGWTSRARGAGDPQLTGFTLDVDSLRLVEYQRGFSPGPRDGSGTKPTPHVYLSEPLSGAGRPGDPGNLDGAILFALKERLSPGEKRFFYLYANPLEYGKREPARFTPEERAPLDALLWGSTGTVYYGWEPQQSNNQHRVHVKALTSQATTVQVFESDGGPFLPVRDTPLTRNPLTLLNGGSGSLLISGGKAFKLVASHPIAVATHGRLDDDNVPSTDETYGYYPATTGSFRGTDFVVYGFGAPPGGSIDQVLAIKAGSGTVTVTSEGVGQVTLTNANPVAALGVRTGQWTRVTATGGEILLSMRGLYAPDAPAPLMQVPALSGGPSGTTFHAQMPRDGGFLRVCPEAYTGVRVVSLANPDLQVYPEGPRETAPPAILDARAGCHQLKAGASTPYTRLEAYAIGAEARHPVPDAPVPFRLLQGADGRDDPTMERKAHGHFGGIAGLDYAVSGRTVVFGYFNNTRVTVSEEMADGTSVNRTFSLSADQFRTLDDPSGPGKTGRYRLLASKPVSVASAEVLEHAYARMIPGLPPMPSATVGAAEFRGPLVELRSADKPGSTSDFRSTGPGTPIDFRLEALNLGRWAGGESLPDTITIACSGPSEWSVVGCGREFPLASGEAARFDVRITPPDESASSTRGEFTIEARSSTTGIASKFLLIVYVEVRYGVGLWFDVENGRKTIDPILGVDPGETHEYAIVVKNTGSTQDSFRFRISDPAQGWTQRLTLDGEEVSEVAIPAGETRLLAFEVTAPDQETAPQNLVSITAESLSTELASARDIVNTATRIRPKINIKLELDPPTRVAEPNETAQFNLTVTNRGNDIFRILFSEDNVLPEGWTSSLGLAEIDLGPGEPYTFPLRVTPPAGAIEGDRATLKISAETDTGGGAARVPGDTVSAVVVVKRIHNLTTPPLLDARADPGQRFQYVLPLQNSGNGDDLVEILPDPAAAWRVRALGDALLVPRNQSADLDLEIAVPQGHPPGLHNLTVTLRLSREDVQTVVIPVDVRPLAKVELRGLSSLDLAPARATGIPLTIVNVGNLRANFTLGSDAPAGWNVTFSPPALDLAPGETRPVTATLNASRDAADGTFDLTLAATVDGADAGSKTVSARLGRPDLHLVNVQTSGKLAPGELAIVAATVGNRGDVEATDVKVALRVDGVTVDEVTLARVPPGSQQVATLSWLATQRGGDVEVVLDPAGEIVMASETDKRAAVAFGSALGVPAAGALLGLAALGAAALVLRRRTP